MHYAARMPRKPRVLVGTLYTEENEFARCCEAISNQEGCELEHFVISNLPKREAHDRLYGTFMQRADEFDMFVKVDADMIITSPILFRQCADSLAAEPQILNLVIHVFDFFTGQGINGLNCFRSSFKWKPRDTELFTDTREIQSSQVRIEHDFPIDTVLHCPDPSPFQAFHYGVHRGIKVAEADPRKVRIGRLHLQWTQLERVWERFVEIGDRRLGLAVAGAEFSLNGTFRTEHIRYDHELTRQVFAPLEGLECSELRRYVDSLRARNAGRFNSDTRFRILKYGYTDAALQFLGRRFRSAQARLSTFGH